MVRIVLVLSQLASHARGSTSLGANTGSILTSQQQGAAATVVLQWRNPTDVLSILLIVGGDVIQKALAQLSGGRLVPVAFSFGWVSYSFGALMSAAGDGQLMPSMPDCPSILVNTEAGYSRTNTSWMLGRVLRDLEQGTPYGDHSLCVTVFRATGNTGTVRYDWVWYSGFAVILLQLAVAAIPWALNQNWLILLATACGTLLALGGGALPQWKAEKWACRPKSPETYCLTRGNGHRQVIVIESAGLGMNLEDLASSRVRGSPYSRVLTASLAIFWLIFLITMAGLREDTWYLLAVGCIGMIQNIIVAGVARDPKVFGIDLKRVGEVKGHKVMHVLMKTEELYPRVGASLVPVYFPGRLRESEQTFWDSKRMQVRNKHEKLRSTSRQALPISTAGPSGINLTNEHTAMSDTAITTYPPIEGAPAVKIPSRTQSWLAEGEAPKKEHVKKSDLQCEKSMACRRNLSV